MNLVLVAAVKNTSNVTDDEKNLSLQTAKSIFMSLKAGITGLPNVGKSTLFNALSNAKAQAANFPFCTISPNTGVVNVADERLKVLASLVQPERVVPTTVEIVDIAGLVQGASKGEGLGNQFLGNIRETDAIIHIVRCFEEARIVHVSGCIDAVRDKEVIDVELQLKDIESVEKRLARMEKLKKSADAQILAEEAALGKMLAHLTEGKNARQLALSEEEYKLLYPLRLLTQKPVIYVCNVAEQCVLTGNEESRKIQEIAAAEHAPFLLVSAAIESEMALMDAADRDLFLSELGLKESGAARIIKAAYDALQLITYFTCGVKEVRAWTTPEGSTAPQAAGVIHSDFEKGFIRAEIIPYQDFIMYGSEAACREKGKIQVQGKDYIMQDGDIAHFRFNV